MSMDDALPATIAKRADTIRKAIEEVRKLTAKRQVADALATRNGPNTTITRELPLLSEVRVWREKDKLWTGPHSLVGMDGETCTIQVKGRLVKFRTTVVRPYYIAQNEDDDEIDLRSDEPGNNQPERV